MTQQELDTLLNEILEGIEAGADMASILAPGIVPFVVIGKALDKMIPGLAGIVSRWISGNPPTDAEVADLRAKLAVLADPNNP